jgi:regulator of replication initiation timing
MPDLEIIKEWLIQNGVNAEELDNVKPPQGIEDIANTLLIALQNTDELGTVITMLLMENESLKMEIESLKQRVEALENA